MHSTTAVQLSGYIDIDTCTGHEADVQSVQVAKHARNSLTELLSELIHSSVLNQCIGIASFSGSTWLSP
jgi:hypothetical protein